MANFGDLQAQVARQKTAIEAAVSVLNGVPAKIAAAVAQSQADGGIDQTAFDGVVADLAANTDKLLAALNPPTPAQ